MNKKENEMLQAQFDRLCEKGKLFRSSVTGEQLWTAYMGAFAVVAMWLGVIQRLWQAWTIWLFKRKMESLKVYKPNIYPCYIRNGTWVIYWLKMVALTAAVGCFIYGAFG